MQVPLRGGGRGGYTLAPPVHIPRDWTGRFSSVTHPASATPSVWPARLLALAAVGVLGLTLAHPSSSRQFTWPWAPGLGLLWLTPIAVCLATPRRSLPTDRLLLGGLGLLALATLASAALSPFAPLSLPRIWPTLGGIALFCWLHHWLAAPDGQNRAGRLALGLAGGGAVIALSSLIHWRWQTAGGSWLTRNEIPFGHSNYTAGAMLLVLPWLLHAAWAARGLRRALWGLVTLAGFVVLLTTSSRGGVLALALTGALFAGGTLLLARWPRRTKLILVAAAAGLLVVVVLANPRLRDLALGRGWSADASESNTQRTAMLQAGLRLGQERPLLGWGPGSVPLTYPKVRAQLDGGTDNVLQLHNTPIQLWATLGTTGLLALALLLAAVLRQGWRTARAPNPAALTALATVTAYGLFALTDHQLDLPALNLLLVASLALLFHRPANTPPICHLIDDKPVVPRAGLAGLALLLLAGPLWATAHDLSARHAYEQALHALERGHEPEGFALLEQAALRAPFDPYYRHLLASRLLLARDQTADATRREQLAATAAEHLNLSLATGCFEEFAHLNLAWLALESDAPRLAQRHFRAALALAPHRGGAYFGLGLSLRASGELAAAVRAFALEWVNDPAAALTLHWHHPELAPYRAGIAREAEAILAELAPAHPTATYIPQLWRWWTDGGPTPTHGFNHASTLFVSTLTALEAHRPIPPGAEAYPWGRLLATWQQTPTDFNTLTRRDPEFAASLARRAARHPAPAVRGFLTAGPEGETNLLVEIRSTRPGYGVLALHPDSPVLADLYAQPLPRMVSAFAASVFPARGWVPARALIARLPAAPATP